MTAPRVWPTDAADDRDQAAENVNEAAIHLEIVRSKLAPEIAVEITEAEIDPAEDVLEASRTAWSQDAGSEKQVHCVKDSKATVDRKFRTTLQVEKRRRSLWMWLKLVAPKNWGANIARDRGVVTSLGPYPEFDSSNLYPLLGNLTGLMPQHR